MYIYRLLTNAEESRAVLDTKSDTYDTCSLISISLNRNTLPSNQIDFSPQGSLSLSRIANPKLRECTLTQECPGMVQLGGDEGR